MIIVVFCSGCCWAFSAVEQVESDAMRTLKDSYQLSVEQVTQCDTTCYGCNGGYTNHAFEYIESAGGLMTAQAYPYTSGGGTTGTCQAVKNPVVTVTGYTMVNSEADMGTFVSSTGPLSVCVDASTWQSYTSGVVTAASCGTDIDHCVQATGVLAQSGGYWIVRNQWGTGECVWISV